MRKWAQLSSFRPARSRFEFRPHYAVSPWTDLVEVYWGKRCQMYVAPIGGREVYVSILSSDRGLRIDCVLARFPSVAKHLHFAQPVSAESGAVMALKRVKAVTRRNVALVGDASCTVDGISGQGLSLAFQQAIHFADALARNELGCYRSAHSRIFQSSVPMTRLLLSTDRSVWLRRKALRLFSGNPGLFSKLISI